MVKADAYGLGAARVARTLEASQSVGLRRATIAEGEELRGVAITRPHRFVFRPCSPADFDGAVRAQLTPTFAMRNRFFVEGNARAWIRRDTGMNRRGCNGTRWKRCVRRWSRVRRSVLSHFIRRRSLRRNARDPGGTIRRRDCRASAAAQMTHAENSGGSNIVDRRSGPSHDRGSFCTESAAANPPTFSEPVVANAWRRVVDLRTVASG